MIGIFLGVMMVLGGAKLIIDGIRKVLDKD